MQRDRRVDPAARRADADAAGVVVLRVGAVVGVTGDPLDRIAERPTNYVASKAFDYVLLEEHERDALVEVARAAREAYEAMERLDAGLETNSGAVTPDWFLLPAQALRAALARLDGPR